MLNSVHVTTAAAIVRLVPNPWIALPAAFASHIVLDTVPHWNWSPGRTAVGRAASVTDGLAAAGISVALSLPSHHPILTFMACFLSTVPDLIQAPYHFWHFRPGWLQAIIGWERGRQKWPWCPMWLGVATQVVTLLVSLAIVFG